MKAQFINTEVHIVRDMEVDSDWEAVEPPADGEIWNDCAGKTTLNEMVAFVLEMWKARDGYTHKDHHAESDALEAALRAAADKLDAAKGYHQ